MGDRPESVVGRAARLLKATLVPDDTLPWRRNPTPYYVLLAEFMLIRTRWNVVARIFEDVVARFPDLHTLARASEAEVEEVLRPLGLHKRAAFLRLAASYLVDHHAGRIPSDPEALRKVPGLGEYTASAVAALAYGVPVVPADVNVFRFLSRLTGLPKGHPTRGSPELRSLLPFLSQANGGPAPAALMDFLRMTCRPRNPDCPSCPVRRICAYGRGASGP